MPKHKRHRSSSSSRRRDHPKRHKHAHSRDKGSRERHNLSRSRDGRSSDSSVHRSCSREKFMQTLAVFYNYMNREKSVQTRTTDPDIPTVQVPSEEILSASEVSGEIPTLLDQHTDEQTAHSQGRGGEPEDRPRTTDVSNVVFSIPEVTDTIELPTVGEDKSQSDVLLMELFGEHTQSSEESSWLPIILDTTKADVRSGLKEDFKNILLSRYEPKGELSFLIPPKVNREILPNLGATVITRDNHHMKSQLQVGASVNALASGLSELSKLELVQNSTSVKAAISKLAEGIRLLADHHFGLSKTRRAFIVPSLNFLGKTASDSTSVDEYLFGTNFAEEVNAAQAIEKVAHKMAKKPSLPPTQKNPSYAASQPRQHRNQPFRTVHPPSKNGKTPSLRTPSTHLPRRGHFTSSRNRRSRSRTRAPR